MVRSFYFLSDVKYFMDVLKENKETNILEVKHFTTKENSDNYRIIKYNKEILTHDTVSYFGLCRSIIVNSKNKIVGFSPPKSLSTHVFMEKYPKCNISALKAEEFVEGTMINVFFNDVVDNWEISTRNNVGGNTTFYKTPNAKTFRQMFFEACKECRLNVNDLDKQLCYSFVLQHPENRIVVPFVKPRLYLVALYKILHKPDQIIVETYEPKTATSFFQMLNANIQFPKIYEQNNYATLISTFGSMNTPYDVVGVVIHNRESGERTKIRNPVYEQVRHLRGNQPKLQYQYLVLRKEGNVKTFLEYYPECKTMFSGFREQVHLFTNTLYANYISCYIKKENTLMTFPKQYRTHMFNLHKMYLDELREKKACITHKLVQEYVNQLTPSLLMYCLNFHLREKRVDEIKNEFSPM